MLQEVLPGTQAWFGEALANLLMQINIAMLCLSSVKSS